MTTVDGHAAAIAGLGPSAAGTSSPEPLLDVVPTRGRPGDDERAAIERSIFWRLVAANVVTGTVHVFYMLITPEQWGAAVPHSVVVMTNLAAVGVYASAALLFAMWAHPRIYRPVLDLFANGRAIDEQARLRLARLPGRAAGWNTLLWLAAAIWVPILNAHLNYDPGTFPVVRYELAHLAMGFVAFGTGYFLVEAPLRRYFAIAFAETEPSRGLSIGRRLTAMWALIAAVPLGLIPLIQVGLTPQQLAISKYTVWAGSALGIALGGLIAVVGGRSVVKPLRMLTDRMHAVARGDLEASIDVEHPAELGAMEHGFNTMVAALRERRRIEELFGRHVSPEVARQALEQTPALGGVRKHASVLFVDLLGSSALAEWMAPEAVVELLNRYFATVVEIVESEGGWVNRFVGDGALCVFGVPAEQSDDTARAMRAARRLMTELEALERAEPLLRGAVGVSSGVVLAANVGTETRYEYTVIGDAVNEAARVVDEAKRHDPRILASGSIATVAGDETANWRFVGMRPLRGRSTITALYEPR